MTRVLAVFILMAAIPVCAQVPTETELNSSKLASQSRPGYFYYAKPYEVTMTVNLWGEVPQQGVYVIPTNTDIVQLISFAGGPKERSNLDEVLLYRSTGRKDTKTRQLVTINLRDILEGKSPTVPLSPGDMIVVKRIPDSLTWQDVLIILNTTATLGVLGVSIYSVTHK
ncbi:MAG TPA: SLBB domain-containing protein [Bacteroidota bacterium]|nr:SLBB domain-containing protein [Bacteroidota bacterium]